MNKRKKLALVSIAIIVACVALDQILKIWVKTHLDLGENRHLLGQWLNLHFIENPGMAFGLSWGDNIGKLALSLVRIGVVGYVIYFMSKRIRKDTIDTLAVCILSLIIAGALGNIIDSAFYGLFFNYAPFMYGNVVDMIYVKLFMIPDWVPAFGGSYFFPAVFNFADSCVTIGLILLFIFTNHFIIDNKNKEKNDGAESPLAEAEEVSNETPVVASDTNESLQ